MSDNNLNAQKRTIRLAKMGMLVAISVVLVYFIHFPIFPAVPFLEYDPADISILIGTFAFGPLAGLGLTVVTSVVQGLTVSAHSGAYGIIMHIIATG
ncbi:MAG: ECF transporter S component, partial [Alphaproteobacteria bacterium]|nr:ECF transporter S component [Alphaproteobacteria bacterium]